MCGCAEEGAGEVGVEEKYMDFIMYACEQEHKLLQCGGGPQVGSSR